MSTRTEYPNFAGNIGKVLKVNATETDVLWDEVDASDITGVLGIDHGGTGANNAPDALNNLLPDQTGHTSEVLHTDGTDPYWAPDTGGGVQSVTGLNTDNTDPLNPVVQISVDGVTVTGDGTPGNPLIAPLTSLQWYAENATAPAVAPVATGVGSIALGDGAEALGSGMFVYGNEAGQNATNAIRSNFLGGNTGKDATNATRSNFFGFNSGLQATNADNSNFFGFNSGLQATNADNSNFFGFDSGYQATDASKSNFIGFFAGYVATNASESIFIGDSSGYQATDASNSIFLGTFAGFSDTVDNTTNPDDFSILIGNNTSTGGFSNSIAIGANATNTSTNQFMIGSTNRPINTVIINGTAGIQVPVGTTVERVTAQGMIRYNTTTSKFEGYDGAVWQDFY